MPDLTITPIIKNTCKSVIVNNKNILVDDKVEFNKILDDSCECISLDLVQKLLKYSKDIDDTPNYLHQLLKGSLPYHYIPPPKPRDPELEKRVQKLRRELENRQYRKMVKNIIEPKGIGRIKNSMELRDAQSQLSVGINIIVTMFSCFVVGWYLGSKAFDDDVMGICVGIICLIIGMMVDMWLFVINASTLDRHVEKQKKKKHNNSKLLPNYQGLIKYD